MNSDIESDDEVRALNIDGIAIDKDDAKFVSKVTGIGWAKNSHQRWNRVINQIGTVIKDEVHQGKNHTTVTLKAGSHVIVDDIRGRINPQYRVKDSKGKIWFISADNVEFSIDVETQLKNKNDPDVQDNYIYRGGIRVDGTDEVEDVISPRYEMPLTTEQEMEILKEKKNG